MTMLKTVSHKEYQVFLLFFAYPMSGPKFSCELTIIFLTDNNYS